MVDTPDMKTTTQHKLPRKSETFRLAAHGKTLTIRRNRGDNDWNAAVEGDARVRFGNAAEIRSDISHFLECGTLPYGVAKWA